MIYYFEIQLFSLFYVGKTTFCPFSIFAVLLSQHLGKCGNYLHKPLKIRIFAGDDERGDARVYTAASGG